MQKVAQKKALDAHRPYDYHAVIDIVLGGTMLTLLTGYAEGSAKESPRHSPALRIGEMRIRF